jgi:hypothetical protein
LRAASSMPRSAGRLRDGVPEQRGEVRGVGLLALVRLRVCCVGPGLEKKRELPRQQALRREAVLLADGMAAKHQLWLWEDK